MELIWQAIILGFTLAVLLGPIFVTLTQLSIEKGARAGLVASLGVWCSDVLILFLCYFFIKNLEKIVQDSTFTHWMGLVGGLILIVFGIGAILNKAELVFEKQNHTRNDYMTFWTKGFLVNTINPFTFVFWIGLMSTYVIGKKLSTDQSILFFGTILFVIVLTDTLKVVGAKMVRTQLTPRHFTLFTRIAGVGLIIFGLSLLVRSGGLI